MKWLALIVFGGIGAGVLAGGLLWGLKRFPLFRDGRRTVGKVVSQEMHRDAREDGEEGSTTSYYPVVEFEALGGEKVRFTGSTGGGGKEILETGAEVEVIYDPAHPQNAQIGSFSQFWLGPVTLSVCGAIFLAMGIGSFFLIRDSDRAFGPKFQERVERDMLVFQPGVLRIRGTVSEFRPGEDARGGSGTLVCSGRVSEDAPESLFYAEEVPADFGREMVGRPVMILVDPKDHGKYDVDIDTLLGEYLQRQKR